MEEWQFIFRICRRDRWVDHGVGKHPAEVRSQVMGDGYPEGELGPSQVVVNCLMPVPLHYGNQLTQPVRRDLMDG